MLKGDRMIVFKYTLTGPTNEEYSFGQELANCGAIVFLESKETTTFGVGIPSSTQEQVLACLQHKLSPQEYSIIEHGIADYEQRLNYYIDALVEQGFTKFDENGKLNEDTLKTAEWLVFNEVIGGEYSELWDMLTKMGNDLRSYMPSSKYDELRRKFEEEYNKMSDEEREKFDEWFTEQVEPAILYEFYGGYHPKGPGAREKKQKFVDYIYMYMIANHKRELDERYDQPLFAEAEEYAEGNVWETKMGMKPYYTGFENKETIDVVRSLKRDELYEYERIIKDYVDKKLSREEIIEKLADKLKKDITASPKVNWEQVADYIIDWVYAEPGNKYNRLIEKYKEEHSKMSFEEREKFDEWFEKEVVPAILYDFYGGYHPTGKSESVELKKKNFVDYVYMYMIANHLRELDERYAQPIIAEAKEFAEITVRD